MELEALDGAVLAAAGEGRWQLRESGPGEPSCAPAASPFVIGRASDCHLVLPESEALRSQTSRRHCHLLETEAGWSVADGSPSAEPDTGRPKPSITGTRVNGRRVSGAVPLRAGDVLEAGPWRFAFVDRPGAARALDATEILRDVAAGTALKVETDDPRLKEQFGQLHELVQRLAQIPGIEESLTALLAYATSKIAAAEAAAILLAHPDGGFAARLAWQKNLGRMPGFAFSAALLASLPPDRSFFLQSRLKDRSESQSVHDISSGLLLPLWGKGERLGVLYLDNRRNGRTFTEGDLYLGSALASLISLQLALEKQAALARVEENMARYFAPDVVERIVEQSAGSGQVGLDVQERDVTVLFVDMEGFTAFSRSKTPREVSELLNPYLETVARAIQSEGGHVNKFIGDAVMGIFGAQPGEAGGDPARYAGQALRAALAIPEKWRSTAVEKRLSPLRLRLGVNSGRAVVGNIGYAARLEYSVLGDTVNQASRLEKQAPPDRACCSQAVRDLVGGAFEFEDLGEREIKGVGAVRLFLPVRETAA
ncbi:MAG: FHA domain-containing protein [Elusimicrobia bacterium]|nr:FHA domain-containing protein [Elusimicrobiota bacterium]